MYNWDILLTITVTRSKTFHRRAIPERLPLSTASRMGLSTLSLFDNLTFLHNAKRRNPFPLSPTGIPSRILFFFLFPFGEALRYQMGRGVFHVQRAESRGVGGTSLCRRVKA